jgi:hypothetical protein
MLFRGRLDVVLSCRDRSKTVICIYETTLQVNVRWGRDILNTTKVGICDIGIYVSRGIKEKDSFVVTRSNYKTCETSH